MMIDALYGELRAHDRIELTSHVAGCAECQERLGRFRAVLGAMDKLPVPPPTGRIAARALNRIDRGHVTPKAGARVWTLVSQALWRLSGSSHRARRGRRLLRVRRETLWTAAWLALTAATIAVAFRLWLPVRSVVDICDRWIHASLGLLPFGVALLFIATASSAGPLFLGRFVFLHRPDTEGAAGNTAAFTIYGAILAPLVYHQCLTLPPIVQALWIAGTVLGAALAGPPSVRWLRRRMARSVGQSREE